MTTPSDAAPVDPKPAAVVTDPPVKPAATPEPVKAADTKPKTDEPAGLLTGDDKAGTDAGKAGDQGKPATVSEGAPEKYEAFKLPEGVVADDVMLEQLTTTAKELNFSQTQAQRMVDLYHKALEGQVTKWAEQGRQWLEDVKKDPDIGGPDWAAKAQVANRAIIRFGGPKIVAALAELGLQNHPEIVRFAYNVGKAIQEDKISKPPAGDKTGGDPDASLRNTYDKSPELFEKAS